MAAIATPSIPFIPSSYEQDIFHIYTHPPQHKRTRKMNHGIHRDKPSKEDTWKHIDSFTKSVDLTSKSANSGSFSPKMDSADDIVSAEGAAGTSHPSSGKS